MTNTTEEYPGKDKKQEKIKLEDEDANNVNDETQFLNVDLNGEENLE
jgi:hypothetical protein